MAKPQTRDASFKPFQFQIRPGHSRWLADPLLTPIHWCREVPHCATAIETRIPHERLSISPLSPRTEHTARHALREKVYGLYYAPEEA